MRAAIMTDVGGGGQGVGKKREDGGGRGQGFAVKREEARGLCPLSFGRNKIGESPQK